MEHPVKNKIYFLEYVEERCIARHQSGGCVQTEIRNRRGNYEYIGKNNEQLHFFSNEIGLDIFISQKKFKEIWKQ